MNIRTTFIRRNGSKASNILWFMQIGIAHTHININPNEIIYYFGTSKWTREIAHEHSIGAMPRNRQTWNARNQEPNICHALVDSVLCWLYARELKRGRKRWFGNVLGKRSLLWNSIKKDMEKNPAFNLRQHYTLVIASS